MAFDSTRPEPRLFSTRLRRISWIGLGAVVLLVSAVVVTNLRRSPPEPEVVQQATAKRQLLATKLPAPVAKLINAPSAAQREANEIEPNSSNSIRRAKRDSIAWIETILAPEWLPGNPKEVLDVDTYLLGKGYSGVDTSHVEWERNGYRVRVSQTNVAFYINMTPMNANIAEGGATEWKLAAQNLASKLFRDVLDERTDIDEVRIALDGTRSILIRSAFQKAKVQQFDDGLLAEPEPSSVSDELDSIRFDFWWRRVGWWTNGRTIGFFTLKSVAAGPWIPRYEGRLDEIWFEGHRPQNHD